MVRKTTNTSGHVTQSKKSLETTMKQESIQLPESAPKEDFAKVTELETKLAVSQQDLEVAKATIMELQSNISRSSSTIDELQRDLINSVPKSDLESVKSLLESTKGDLEQKLAASIPKDEADKLRTKITELETKLAQSIPKDEADTLLENARVLERALNETRQKLTLAETNRRDLETKLTNSVTRTELETAKIAAKDAISRLQKQLEESKGEADILRVKSKELEFQLAERNQEALGTHIVGAELTEFPSVNSESEENIIVPACSSCNASAFQGDVYCGNCGRLL